MDPRPSKLRKTSSFEVLWSIYGEGLTIPLKPSTSWDILDRLAGPFSSDDGENLWSPTPNNLKSFMALDRKNLTRYLPDGLQYHCFMSSKETIAVEYNLTKLGFKLWYGKQFNDGELNLVNRLEGVKHSMTYCLFLSNDIFPTERKVGVTYVVDEEVKMAVALKKPIMLFHHPDTGAEGYWSFNEYIKYAPDVLKPYFEESESIQFRTKYFEEEATTKEIVNRLEKILGSMPPESDEKIESCTSFVQLGYHKRIREVISEDARVPYGRTKLMFVGQGRAGKTSTIRKLMRKGFDPQEQSTRGFEVTMTQATNWKEEIDVHYMAEFLQNAFSSNNINSIFEADSEDGQANEADDIILKEIDCRERSFSGDGISSFSKSDDHDENIALKPDIDDEEIKKYGEILASTENKLSFSIWDFGGQEVFYTLHHLFLTEYGCYVLVFDMKKVYDSATKNDSLNYLEFWLFSKKIHAPSAPVIIVGTHSANFDFDGRKEISMLLDSRVLCRDEFNEYRNGSLCFFPIDNMVGNEGIYDLRKKIEDVITEQSYIKEPVPSSFLRVLDHLLDLKVDYLKMEDVNKILARCGLNRNRFDDALNFLNMRGLLNYFKEPAELGRFVVLQPQWIINGITSIFFNDEQDPPDFDRKLNILFRRFRRDRVINDDLLTDIWTRKGYTSGTQTFLKSLMIKGNLMCEYNFSEAKEYLIPSLVSAANYSERLIEPSKFTGQYFIIDFSGAYDQKISNDVTGRFVRYLPLGLFERLVCLCVEHSSTFEEKLRPEIHRESAILTYGNEFSYELSISENREKQRLWVKVIMDREREQLLAMKLVKTIYSMVSTLKQQYFSSKDNVSVLAMSLLIPSDKGVLAEYENIKKRKERGMDAAFWPHANSETVKPSDYNFWFDERSQESLTEPNLAFQKQFENDKSLKFLSSVPGKPLPSGLQYHCFLSYKQVSAIDLVGKQFYILAGRGFKCWWDMQYREGDLNLGAMLEGVRKSMVYCLHLSKDIFPIERKAGVTYFVDEEVKMAVALKKPIMLLHHPDTGTQGYWSFGDYIKNAPDVLKPYFNSVQSLQIQRLYYLEEATTEQIVTRLNTIMDKLVHPA